jgi:hypothetical protein
MDGIVVVHGTAGQPSEILRLISSELWAMSLPKRVGCLSCRRVRHAPSTVRSVTRAGLADSQQRREKRRAAMSMSAQIATSGIAAVA